MAIDDSLLKPRPGMKGRPLSPSEIADRHRPHPEPPPDAAMPPPEREKAGPESFDPESGDYKAHGWSDNKPVPSLRFILKDRSERACPYGHLDSDYPGGCEFIPSAPGKGNVIKLRFAGHSRVVLVVIEGVRLRRVWELIMNHQTPWVHELPAEADFHGGTEAVVKSIRFEVLKD